MNIENQVVSLELSKKLKSLNLKQDSLFYWFELKKGKWECWELIHLMQHWECCHMRDDKPVNKISAFTIAELGEILPAVCIQPSGRKAHLFIGKEGNTWFVKYKIIGDDYPCLYSQDFSEANARARILISLIENNLLKL